MSLRCNMGAREGTALLSGAIPPNVQELLLPYKNLNYDGRAGSELDCQGWENGDLQTGDAWRLQHGHAAKRALGAELYTQGRRVVVPG
jgi:hypothetical protein